MDEAYEKPRSAPREGPPREVIPRDDVHVVGSPLRCPFCHEDVAIEGEWSACSRCLARHHEACWSEGGRCGACGHDSAIRHEREVQRTDVKARSRSIGPLVVALLLAVIGVAAGGLLGYLRAVSASNARVEARRAEQPALVPVEQRPAARYEKDGALVVEDGRGSFVIVLAAEDSIVFGLNVVFVSIDAEKITYRQGHEATISRRAMKPLIIHEVNARGSYGTDLATRRMNPADLATLLRATPPADQDLAALLKRVLDGR